MHQLTLSTVYLQSLWRWQNNQPTARQKKWMLLPQCWDFDRIFCRVAVTLRPIVIRYSISRSWDLLAIRHEYKDLRAVRARFDDVPPVRLHESKDTGFSYNVIYPMSFATSAEQRLKYFVLMCNTWWVLWFCWVNSCDAAVLLWYNGFRFCCKIDKIWDRIFWLLTDVIMVTKLSLVRP